MFLFARWKCVSEYDDGDSDDDEDSHMADIQSFDSVQKVSKMLSRVYRFYDKICITKLICAAKREEGEVGGAGRATKRQTILYDNTQ